jgi:hypothetical protein
MLDCHTGVPDKESNMIVHFRDYGVEPEFDDLDAFMHDDGRPGVGQAARAAPTRRALSPRILRAINPMLDADDDLDDFSDFDVREFVGRSYQ